MITVILQMILRYLMDRLQSAAGFKIFADKGNISICGKDIREIPIKDLMNEISMVFQKVYLFQDTIYNNILMGKSNATKEEVIKTAKKARCYDFIMEFENLLKENGIYKRYYESINRNKPLSLYN